MPINSLHDWDVDSSRVNDIEWLNMKNNWLYIYIYIYIYMSMVSWGFSICRIVCELGRTFTTPVDIRWGRTGSMGLTKSFASFCRAAWLLAKRFFPSLFLIVLHLKRDRSAKTKTQQKSQPRALLPRNAWLVQSFHQWSRHPVDLRLLAKVFRIIQQLRSLFLHGLSAQHRSGDRIVGQWQLVAASWRCLYERLSISLQKWIYCHVVSFYYPPNRRNAIGSQPIWRVRGGCSGSSGQVWRGSGQSSGKVPGTVAFQIRFCNMLLSFLGI